MKYSGLKTVEVRICKNESVVNNLKSAAPQVAPTAPVAVAYVATAAAKPATVVAPTAYTAASPISPITSSAHTTALPSPAEPVARAVAPAHIAYDAASPATVSPVAAKSAPAKPAALSPATAAARATASPKKRRLLGLFKQIIICALVLATLLGLKFADGGFAEDVFKNVKDIVSYNYEISNNIYDKDGATLVSFIEGLFKAKNA
jgi:hypothetical protein